MNQGVLQANRTLDILLVGHDIESIALADHAGLALAHGDGSHVLVLVDDAHAEGLQGVPRKGVHIVQDLKQRAASVPAEHIRKTNAANGCFLRQALLEQHLWSAVLTTLVPTLDKMTLNDVY